MKRAIFLLGLIWLLAPAWAQPVADFTSSVQAGCSPIVVNFENLSTGATSYQWQLGNGSSTLKDPGQLYAAPGTYDVQLIAIAQNGSRDTILKEDYITVYAYPKAEFYASDTVVCTFESIQFTDASLPLSGTMAQWSWDFGDGNTSTLQHPTHVYTQPGDYQVSLVVQNQYGCGDDFTRLNYITVMAPDAQFTGDPLLACGPPLGVNFTPVSTAGQHQWLFGDGQSGNVAQPGHSYQQYGNFSVTHIVTDGNGCRDTLIRNNYVNIGINTLSAYASDSTLCANDSVFFFTNASQSSEVIWSFGNGDSSTLLNPGYKYTQPGSYMVDVSITDPSGCDVALSVPIVVFPKPTVNFSVVDTTLSCNTPFTVEFENLSTNGVTYMWNFGDGQTSTLQNPIHVYNQVDSFDVRLQVWGANGCVAAKRYKNFIRIEPVETEFDAYPTSGCAPITVAFNDTVRSPFPITSWEWDFGDGTTSTQQYPQHVYADTGYYDVQLIVTNSQGCSDTLIKTDYISAGEKPSLAFEVDTNRACALAPIQFINQSTGADRFLWYFGDGDTAMSVNPSHGFGALGMLGVTLIGFDRGCPDTLAKADYVEALAPLPIMGISDKRVCVLPSDVLIQNLSIQDTYWNWTVDSGQTYTSRNFTHTFTAPGTYEVTLIVGNSSTGCEIEAKDYIQVYPLEPDVALDTNRGCTPLIINFENNTPFIKDQIWYFGTGDSSKNATESFRYKEPGAYPVSVYLRNRINCRDTLDLGIITALEVDAKMEVDATGACVPSVLNFSDLSEGTGPLNQWKWSMDGQVFSQQPDPQYVFSQAGSHDIKLWVQDVDGCQDSVEKSDWLSITQPIVDFVITPPVNCEANATTFVSLSSGKGLEYLWEFGDGDSSQLASVTHAYLDTGYYDVSLTVTDVNGCDTSMTIVQGANIRNLDAYFTADSTFAPCPPLTVSFSADTTFPHDGLHYFWDFGDGTYSTEKLPQKSYLLPGVYDVSLVISTDDGCADTVAFPEMIEIQGPTGEFVFDPSAGCPGTEVNFWASSSDSVDFEWVFGDGMIGSGDSTQHVYHAPGAYVPTLVVVDNRGCRVYHVSDDPVVVYTPPEADFSADSLFCDSAVVTFNEYSNGASKVLNWAWDFGSIGVDSVRFPTVSFDQLGEYDVTLVVTDERGCKDTLTREDYIRIVPSPEPVLLPSDQAGCISFTGLIVTEAPGHPYPITAWNWDLGSGPVANSSDQISFEYPIAGQYTASVTVTDENQCSGEAQVVLEAFPLPAVDFMASDSFGCAPFDVVFTTTGEPEYPLVEWDWSFGDGGESTEETPAYQYVQDGIFGVSLTVRDSNGCESTFAKEPYIHLDHPVAAFSLEEDVLCPGETLQVSEQSQSDTTLVTWNWDFGDGQTSQNQSPTHNYQASGTFGLSLWVEDVFGCRDSMTQPAAVTVLTDEIPEPTSILYVSVLSPTQVEVVYEEYPEATKDFGAYIILRSQDGDSWKEVTRIHDRAQARYVDAVPNAEERSYCYKIQVVNHCGTATDLDAAVAHCTISLTPETTAGLEAVFLNWSPYVGWSTVRRYRLYRVQDYNPANAELMASLSGKDTSFVDWDMHCYDDYHYRVQAIGPDWESWSDVGYAAPDHNPPAEASHVRRVTVEDNSYLTVEWDLAEIENPVGVLLERQTGASGQFVPVLTQPYSDPNLKFQDVNVDVASQQYTYRLFTLDTCGDFTPVGRIGKNIQLDVEQEGGRVTLQWSAYEGWENGVEKYLIEVYDEQNARYQSVGQVPGGQTAFIDKHVLDQGSSCYRITAYEKEGNQTFSMSNEACVIPQPRLYRPNAFTPNGDGVNDVFLIQGSFVSTYSFVVFNRWGEKLFESDQMAAGWDGTDFNGRSVPTGTYTYRVKGVGFSGDVIELGGTVHLIR